MRRPGFTLIELLVVIIIVVTISIIALPIVIPAIAHRQVSAAARTVQASLAGARDEAIRTNAPAGIRLLPDPAFPIIHLTDGSIDPSQPLAANRVISIASAPAYRDGSISVFPDAGGGSSNYPAAIRTVNGYAGVPCLVLEQSPQDTNRLPNPPTNWFWNIRVGDQIQINNAGRWYTIVGPMTVANPEMFVNIGVPGTPLPQLNGPAPCEYLLLVNGRDDNGNGWIDEGFDGIDNDLIADQVGNLPILTDDPLEWEVETWW